MTVPGDHRILRLLDAIRALDADGHLDYITTFIPHLKVVEITSVDDADLHRHPRLVFEYTVQPEHCNRMNNMHGGATATLFDFCTSLAMLLVDGSKGKGKGKGTSANDNDNTPDAEIIGLWARSGVSRTLAVTYVRPAPCHTPVRIECELVHAGQRLASLRGLLRRRSDGAVLASCEHGKALLSKI